VGNGDFYNLPRKFKVCITGLPCVCAPIPEINDVGLTAIRQGGKDSEIGFSFAWCGGRALYDPHSGA
jgi:sulfite reductase (ferredoxin)